MGGKRTTPILVALVFVALVAGALISPAGARSPLGRVALGGVNFISGDRLSGIPVHVPRQATIEGDPFANDDVSYSGPGRVVGIVLVEEGGPLRKAFELISVRWSFCGSPGCSPGPHDEYELTTSPDFGRKRWRIPAGNYRLYLVADGEPVEVTLRLHGLDGTTDLRPADRVTGRVAAPTASAPDPAGHLFLGRSAPVEMDEPGLLIDSYSSGIMVGPSAAAEGTCFWRSRGDEEVTEATPGPHCLTFAERYGFGGGGGSLIGGGAASWGLDTVPAGTWRSSYWAVNATAFPQSQFLTLWLSYEGRA